MDVGRRNGRRVEPRPSHNAPPPTRRRQRADGRGAAPPPRAEWPCTTGAAADAPTAAVRPRYRRGDATRRAAQPTASPGGGHPRAWAHGDNAPSQRQPKNNRKTSSTTDTPARACPPTVPTQSVWVARRGGTPRPHPPPRPSPSPSAALPAPRGGWRPPPIHADGVGRRPPRRAAAAVGDPPHVRPGGCAGCRHAPAAAAAVGPPL